MKVDLIHNVGHNNMVRDVLSEHEEFQAMNTIQILMFTSEKNLWGKTKEGYNDYPEAQRLLGELRKGKALEEIKLVDGLLKDKQSWVYGPQGDCKLRWTKVGKSPLSIENHIHHNGKIPWFWENTV
jgi:hypothetical protein